uniref:Uncharacterized protein n=1 Tax=Rheinheimera sp. BAL341 TaxID=1708203 RepID=A0A486XQ76_9GAMM
MKTSACYWFFLACIIICTSSNAEQFEVWSKLEVTAELPLPYGKTSVAFYNETRVLNQVGISTQSGQWMFTHPDLNYIPISSLIFIDVIPFQNNCASFQQNCISFGWFVGKPQYITFDDGTRTGFSLHVDLKITDKGDFDLKVDDMYQDALKMQKFLAEPKKSSSETPSLDDQGNANFSSLSNFSLPNYYYGSRSFYYELPAGMGSLTIKNNFIDQVITDYKLELSSGDSVNLTNAIKERGLQFSYFSSPLVSVDRMGHIFTVVVPCLLNDPEDETHYTAARFTIASNSVISTSFVKQDTQYRVCELKD